MNKKQTNISVYKKLRRDLYRQVEVSEKRSRRSLIVIVLSTLLLASVLLFSAALLEAGRTSKHTYLFGDTMQMLKTKLAFAKSTQYIDINALADFCGMEKGTFFSQSTYKINGTEASFENGSNIAVVNGIEHSMDFPAVITNGYCLISIESARDIFRGIEIDAGKSETSISKNANNVYMITNKYDIEYITDVSKYLDYINSNDEYIHILANKENPLREGFALPDKDLSEIPYEYRKDSKISLYTVAEKALEAMMQDMFEAGYTDTYVTSAYRDYDYQYWLFYENYLPFEKSTISDDAIAYFGEEYIQNNYYSKGLTKLNDEDALAVVLSYSSEPGKSEHHTGLCVDFTTKSIDGAVDTVFETTEVYNWLIENSWKYGFILRYPADKVDITGYSYEPWHYRFIGLEVASEIHQTGLCYEEYLENFNIKGE